MRITVNVSTLGQTKWYEYAIRFFFGGLVTVAAGLLAKKFGPTVGGLFLAFPAIFPASATLIEKHERERKEERGLAGKRRGREAAAVDAAGAALGSIGLLVFASVAWRLLPRYAAWMVLLLGTLAWAAVSVLLWMARHRISHPLSRRSQEIPKLLRS